jgi:protein-S-isoprenylcysteine O-methyltransferase Ste14
MTLIEEFERVGNWLFRWRGYIPLVLLILIISSLRYFSYPFGSYTANIVWELFCLLISFVGLGIRVFTVGHTPEGTSGRNTRTQVADSLNTTGMYSVVRNPLYLSNFIIGAGFSLFLRVWWVPVIYILLFALYYERIIFAEEMFLREKFGQRFSDWASHTPAFFPLLSQWKHPDTAFSLRKVLKKEHQTFFMIIVTYFVMETLTELYLGHGFRIDTIWRVILGIAIIIFISLRILSKRTTIFNRSS